MIAPSIPVDKSKLLGWLQMSGAVDNVIVVKGQQRQSSKPKTPRILGVATTCCAFLGKVHHA